MHSLRLVVLCLFSGALCLGQSFPAAPESGDLKPTKSLAELTGNKNLVDAVFNRVKELCSESEREILGRVKVEVPDTDWWIERGPISVSAGKTRKIIVPMGYLSHLYDYCRSLDMESRGVPDASIRYFEYFEAQKGLDIPVLSLVDFATLYQGWKPLEGREQSIHEATTQRYYENAVMYIVVHECGHHALSAFWPQSKKFENQAAMEAAVDSWADKLLLKAGTLPLGGAFAALHLHRVERSRIFFGVSLTDGHATHPHPLDRALATTRRTIRASKRGEIDWDSLGLTKSLGTKNLQKAEELLAAARDDAKARTGFKFYKDIAHRSPKAAYMCYRILKERKGADKEMESALRYLVQSAQGGFHWALCDAGWRHETGDGLEKDKRLAISAYTAAAKQGSIYAKYRLKSLRK